MSKIRLAILLAALSVASAFAAESKADYTLYERILKFKAPAEWNVIMEKRDGNPQFIAFQVKDPADAGNNEIAQVTVSAKLMHDSSFFQQVSEGVDPTVMRYYAMNGKTRYEYRETFYLVTHLFLHVRCSRPLLKETTAAWTDAYDKGCAD